MSKEIDAYLAKLPDDRRAAITTLYKLVKKNLPKGYAESLAYGMLSWEVPLSVYPDTYNKKPLMYAALASQKSHMAIYLLGAYGIVEVRKKLEADFAKAGKKLDMGKSCLRFKKLDDLPLDAVARAIAATPMDKYVAFAKSVYSPEAKAARKKTRSGAAGGARARQAR
jgi:hypothetical protein